MITFVFGEGYTASSFLIPQGGNAARVESWAVGIVPHFLYLQVSKIIILTYMIFGIMAVVQSESKHKNFISVNFEAK